MITLGNVLSFVQLSSLIDFDVVQEIGSKNNWTTPLASYLKNGVLLDGKEATRELKVQAERFVLIKLVLYKRGFSRHERGTRGDLWKPFEVKIISAQASASRVLLAHHAEGCRGLCQDLRQVPKVQQYY